MRAFSLTLALVVGGTLAIATHADTTLTKLITSFDDPTWTGAPNGPIGRVPCGLDGIEGQTGCKWKYQLYGPPAWTSAEQVRVFDGPLSFAWKLPFASIPGTCGTGSNCYAGSGILIWDVRHPLDWFVAPRQIDWTKPITLSVVVNGFDPSVGGKLYTGINISNPTTGPALTRTVNGIEWGDNGETNHEWRVATCVIPPNQDPSVGIKPVLFVDFAFASTDIGEAEVFFDRITITYTPMPIAEVCDNGEDDDIDGLTDCWDSDCTRTAACPCNMERPFDIDYDTDVDQVDFAFFQRCISTDAEYFVLLSPECRCMDRTGPLGEKDSLVAEHDLISLIDCASGPGVPSIAGCGQ